MRFISGLAVSVLALGLAAPAFAEGPLAVSGGATAISDYRFRGISLSGEDPAIQGSLNFNHESGVYAGVWGSSLEDTPLYGEAELDFYAGWRGEVASGTSLDVGLLYYAYPLGDSGAGPSDYFEPYASLSHVVGPVTAKVGAAYAWAQDATADGDNLYVFTDLSAAIPSTPVTLRAHLGHSGGSLSPTGDYFEWVLGADIAAGPATIGLSYVDTDLGSGPNVDATLVVSLGFSF
jgi:uncharacterized protein (TIGR02001 family)